VESSGHSGEKITIVNDGYIGGGSRGMSLYEADYNIVNRGEIDGNVLSLSGDSSFDFRGGKLNGKIHGGDGDDTYLVSSLATGIVENKDMGHDTIKSTVSYDLSTGINGAQHIEALQLLGTKNIKATGNDQYNELIGNAGKNVLSGGGGIDYLDGGKGNDRLIGGSETDFFAFKTGGGHDVIKDFVEFTDQIDLTSWTALASFSDLMKNHVHFENGNTIIEAGKDTLTLLDTSKAELDSVDFFF